MFEVSATDTQALTITFEVPAGMAASGSMGYEEAMMSVQLDLSSNVEVKSTIFSSTDDVCPESFLDNAIQRWVKIWIFLGIFTYYFNVFLSNSPYQPFQIFYFL